jgi:serine protease Do
MMGVMNKPHLVILALALAPTLALADYVELVAQTKPAVVQIETQGEEGDALGSGFFITSNGCVMTNWHVVSDARRNSDVTVVGNDGTRYAVQGLLYVDKKADLAILKCDCTNVTFLEVDPADDLAEGENVLVIGNPQGYTGTVSSGIVSALRRGATQITAPISLGSSGSPVMNEQGLVVGVAVRIYDNDGAQNINFAVSLARSIQVDAVVWCQA